MSATTSEGQELAPVPTTTPVPDATTTAPAAAAAPELPEDVDDRAVALAKAEAAKTIAEMVDGVPKPAAAAVQTPSQPQAQPQKPRMVPVSRLADEARRREKAEQDAAYYKGALEARTAQQPQQGQQPGQRQQAAPATQQDQVKRIEEAIVAEQQKVLEAAGKFDNGEITMSDFKRIEIGSANMIASLRERVMLDVVRGEMPRTPPPSLADQDLLNRHLQEMTAKHPWSAQLTPDEIKFLGDVAKAEFEALGKPIGQGSAETIRWRTRVAQLATRYGPDWYPNRQVATQAAAGQPQQQQAQQAQRPAAQQRGVAGAMKLELAAKHPPNVNQAGSTGNSSIIPTNAEVAAMSTEEIAALPNEVRQRLLMG